MAGDSDHCRDVHTHGAMCIACCDAKAGLPDTRRFDRSTDRPHPASMSETHAAGRP
jgi:hypothetical protein